MSAVAVWPVVVDSVPGLVAPWPARTGGDVFPVRRDPAIGPEPTVEELLGAARQVHADASRPGVIR